MMIICYFSWPASCVIGSPRVYPKYGDIPGAWAPGGIDQRQFLEVFIIKAFLFSASNQQNFFHPKEYAWAPWFLCRVWNFIKICIFFVHRWNAAQVIGLPKVYPNYGDRQGAWAMGIKDANQYLEVYWRIIQTICDI